MAAYLLRRLLLVIPTLFGIILINFAVVQFAPGGPVEQMLAELRGEGQTMGRITGEGGGEIRTPNALEQRSMGGGGGEGPVGTYRGARGLDPAIVAEIERAFGFDKPATTRFKEMILLWSTLLIYLISIPLGIRKAVRDGSRFDVATSAVVLIGYAIPGFLFAIVLVVFFAGGSFFQWFPLRGLNSPGSETWSLGARMMDYAWHMVLPTIALVIGGFATLTMLTKNAFLDEIGKQYVLTARAKGGSESRVLYGHIFRNAMMLIIAGFPAAFIGILFTGALLVEIVFSLDGLGLLGFESAIRRDYPVMFATLYIFTLMGLVMQIIGDFTYTLVDPRIDFEARR
ncbi:MAG: ABC transporter permease subunit [Acetobacteraceae bacterium]|nr:ABC transporter permease subunit [Acetobacteraceae bacterium]